MGSWFPLGVVFCGLLLATPVITQNISDHCQYGDFNISDVRPSPGVVKLKFICSNSSVVPQSETGEMIPLLLKQFRISHFSVRMGNVELDLEYLTLSPVTATIPFNVTVTVRIKPHGNGTLYIPKNVTLSGTLRIVDLNDPPQIQIQPVRSTVREGPFSVGRQWRIKVSDPDIGKGKNKSWEQLNVTSVGMPAELKIHQINVTHYVLELLSALDAEDPRWIQPPMSLSIPDHPMYDERTPALLQEFPMYDKKTDFPDFAVFQKVSQRSMVEFELMVSDGGGLNTTAYVVIDIADENDNIPYCRPIKQVKVPREVKRRDIFTILILYDMCRDDDISSTNMLAYRFMDQQECPYAFDIQMEQGSYAALLAGRGYPPQNRPQCHVTLTVSDALYSTEFAFDVVFAQCPPEVDSWNTTWEAGWPGRRTFLNGLCPEGFQGYASRLCDDNAAWHAPFYNCTSETLVKIQQEFYGPSANVTRALIQLANFTSDVNGAAQGLTVGDVQATTSLMTSITDVASRQNNLTTGQIKDYLEVADNLMEDSCKTSWKSIINETRTGVDTVLDNIDKFVEVMSRKEWRRAVGDEYAKANFYLAVKSAGNCYGDIKFPLRASETIPKWANSTVDSIYLPCSKGLVGAAYGSVMYRDLRDVMPQRTNENDTKKEVLNSPVMSLTLFQKKDVPLDNKVFITFQLFEKMHSFIPRCSYWKQGSTGGWWDTDGCTLDSFDEAGGVVVCKCSHLTNFAILMSQVPASKDHTQALSIISLVGCIVSMLFLALTMCLYLGLWSFVRGERSILLLNLCIALFVAYLVFLAGVNAIENKDVCTFVAVFLHYVYLVVFFIMLTKGLLLGKTVLKPFNKTPIAKWCLLGTYGGAAVIVGISMAVTQLEGYGTSTSCWLSIDSGLIWAFLGPVLLVIVINSIIIVLVLRSMYGTAAMSKKTNKEKTMTGLRSVGVLLPVMGVAWLFGVFSVSEDTVVFQYFFAIFNSLQGLLIFIFHCIMNQKIREGLSKKLKKDRSFTSSTDKKSQNTSNTNM